MIILLWILGFFVVAIGGLALMVAAQTRRERRARSSVTPATMPGWVQAMLRESASGSHLIFDANQRDGFLQIALTAREGDWRRVELALPDAAWSHDTFALAVFRLGEGADKCEVEERRRNAKVPRFLRVTIEGDSEDVFERVADLLQSMAGIFEFRPEQTFTVSGYGPPDPGHIHFMANDFEQRFPRGGRVTQRIAGMIREHADTVEEERDAPTRKRPVPKRIPTARNDP